MQKYANSPLPDILEPGGSLIHFIEPVKNKLIHFFQ